MKCKTCSTEVPDYNRFCPNCGTTFELAQAPSKPDRSVEFPIGYGTSFSTYFLGMTTRLRVTSPVNVPAPTVSVELTYQSGGANQVLSISGAFFESLLAVLASIKQHTELLAGSELSFLGGNDPLAMLYTEVGSGEVKVFRRKGALGGSKDIVQIRIQTLTIERELNDDFFNKIDTLRSQVDQVKRKIAEKIQSYVNTRKR